MASRTPTKSEIVAKLNLKPHPEGGFYCETFRDNSILLSKSHLPPQYKVDRPVSTSIYFLLPSGCVSHLHRIPCAETWHFYLGEPLTHVVPPNVWFGAFPTKDIEVSSDLIAVKRASRDPEEHFSLVGCTCAPAFQFDDFELAKHSKLISCFPKYESLISMLTFPE
ncbi:UNVERIFIED_CONTAM: hypothetical protein Sangu_1524300 [Sesamum angustifolium]|uniref:DUF985 domain-containing protein n=1 Tax=Sesamum angustifolium TaxID=2727405 RepID=A0AAW2MT42_9LAMI